MDGAIRDTLLRGWTTRQGGTLELIVTDKSYEDKLVMPRWLEERTMSDNYEDDLEIAGPGLVAEKAEGAEMQLGTIREGVITRYIGVRAADWEEPGDSTADCAGLCGHRGGGPDDPEGLRDVR